MNDTKKSNIKDNYHHGAVGDFLKQVIAQGSELSVVSAYFTIYAYERLKSQLNKIEKMRFLYGEPRFLKHIDPSKTNPRSFKIEDEKLVIPLENKIKQNAIAKECHQWLQDKAEIYSITKDNFLHGKLYHCKHKGGMENSIVGSSNFTVRGLGLGNRDNIELNLIVDSDRDRQELKNWFNTIWSSSDLVEDVKGKVLEYLKQLYIENPPDFLYYKTLYHIFEDFINEQSEGGLLDEKTGFFESEIWQKLYDFQKDGVKGAINKILRHNGCIIADSVGLGKTYEALAVIRYFELQNDRVLVLCPKKLAGNWTIYQASQNHKHNPFINDRFGYTVLSHTDMGRTGGISEPNSIDLENFNFRAFNLVVIDESHNFRGNPENKKLDDGSYKPNRAQFLMEKIIQDGVNTKVLLLSATPVNNSLKDLRNQIALITKGNDNALLDNCNIASVAETIKIAQSVFTKWVDDKSTNLHEELNSSFFTLLDELTIARSREHIKNYYDIEKIGKFPQRNKPRSIYTKLATDENSLSYDDIHDQIQEYKLNVYHPSAYVLLDKQKKYQDKSSGRVQFKQTDREYFLIGMMKVSLLKRLESSIDSFRTSLLRTINKIDIIIDKINEYQNKHDHIAGDEEYSPEEMSIEEDEYEDLSEDSEAWQVGKKLKFDLADLDLTKWLIGLEDDKSALKILLRSIKHIEPKNDAKLKELKKLIVDKLSSSDNTNNKKVIIFTAYSDTAEYLYNNLIDWANKELKLHIALISGSATKATYGRKDYNSILTNFSPKSKNRNKYGTNNEDEIDILVATDCISEGQNLQDCDTVINYDIHWNPVRIIQRYGRIDRLGSDNCSINLINFWPTEDLDKYINLKARVECKMALVDVSATGNDNILEIDNAAIIKKSIEEELKYRDKQIKKLKNEILDLEDMDESVSLTDFTLDDFRIELQKYIEKNRKKLQESPLGLYAIVPSPSGEYSHLNNNNISVNKREIIKPGVIFCFSHNRQSVDNAAVNPLKSFFLVYIRDDGTVRYNYTNAKRILEVYRLLCQDKTQPYDDLCTIFTNDEKEQKNYEKYTKLLKKSAEAIIDLYQMKNRNNLTNNPNAILPLIEEQVRELDDFDLITWLIVR